MADVERQLKDVNLDEKYVFPDVVLLKIFSQLAINDLGSASKVCKQWNKAIHCDSIWRKFIPKFSWFVPPFKAKTAFQIVAKLWKKSVKIGQERWFPNPLPELVKYDTRLRKAEYHNFYRRHSSATLMLRLNPRYEFTTKGKDMDDTMINETCDEIWTKFGGKDPHPLEVTSYQDVMRRAEIRSRKKAMEKILITLQPHWFVRTLGLDRYNLDEDGNIIIDGAGVMLRESTQVKDEELGDVARDSDESLFGSFGNKTAWRTKVNKPLPIELYRTLKDVFADKSEHFIEYHLSCGCFNENFEYAYSLLISDTAVFHIKQFYEL